MPQLILVCADRHALVLVGRDWYNFLCQFLHCTIHSNQYGSYLHITCQYRPQLSSDKQGAQMESSSNNQSTIPVNLGLQQLSSTAKQSKQVEMIPWFHSTMPVNFGSQQLSTSEKHQAQTRGQVPLPVNLGAYPLQSIPMQPPLHAQTNMPVFFGLQQLSSTNRRPSAIQPLHYVQASTSSKNRRPVQIEASPKFQKSISANLGSPQPLSTSKRPSQVEPSLKVQTESLESVRSKLRESLTSALSMVSEKQNKSQNVEKASPGDASSRENQAEMGTQPVELPSVATDASLRGTSETLTLNEQCQKHDEGQGLSCHLGSNENTSDTTEILKSDEQKSQLQHVPLDDKMLFRSDSVIKDELLLGHGLCWASDIDAESSEVMLNHDPKRPKLIQVGVSENNNNTVHQSSENLAAKIEAELYKLFGGVNKKYKEKARSLLFNLKDPSNPELRDRVISGDIAPGRLCSMTAEELASKELSEWRLAKAEELAHMVVLQDSEVDIRRLVRKTHKGEFQVEVEHDDGTSVEVGVGTDILTQIPTKAKANEKVQTQVKSIDTGRILSKPSETKAPEGLQLPEKADAGDQKISSNVDTLAQERTDLMQEFMVDELKDTELLPPIVSLDEFMEALDKEPPFVNLDNEQDIPSSAERNSDSSVPEMSPAPDKPEPKMDPASDSLGSKLYSLQDSLVSKVDPADTVQENFEEIAKDDTDKVDDKDARNDSTLIAGSVHVQTDNYLADTSSKSENIWEGMVQFNISAPAMVICFFKSGERTSTQEWPNFLEIKGRVRLDAFEKFLQELPLSRSRAIMIAQLCWKEGSPETGRLHLMEAVNSYIVDERVGFAEPAAGVELYLCPSHTKTTEILSKHLPKDEAEEGGSADAGLVAVVVWRRPHATTVSPRLSKHHHKHKKQGGSRKQQDEATEPPPPSRPDEVIDDVPPGFGPPRDDDDLPEFDFVCTNSSRMAPAEQMRELVHMYGDGGGKRALQVRSWNDDEDDDIPEWRPKPPPPPPPIQQQQQQQLHIYQHPGVAMSQQQHMMPPQLQLQHMMPMQPQQQQQHMMPMQPQLQQQQQQHMMSMQPQQQQQQQQLPFALQMQHHQLGVIPPGWQWWPQPCGPADVILPMMINGVMQPCQFGGGQMSQGAPAYGMPGSVQNSAMMMGWRPDNPRGG